MKYAPIKWYEDQLGINPKTVVELNLLLKNLHIDKLNTRPKKQIYSPVKIE